MKLISVFLLILTSMAWSQSVFDSSSTRSTKKRVGKIYNYVGPWKKNITSTVFWIGEKPAGANKTPNHKSSWDTNWAKNFGGFDDPDPKARTGYRPKAFIPRQNPFYIALPYNDLRSYNRQKPEAAEVIPWHKYYFVRPGRSICKGVWVQIIHDGKSCFAQWEDCGPWNTDDYEYVFGDKQTPKTSKNGAAGIDVSPAVRDFLGLQSGEKCHWRFVPFHRIPEGPWRLYGTNNPFRNKEMIPIVKNIPGK